MNKAQKILNLIEIQESEEIKDMFWPVLTEFYKKLKAVGGKVDEGSHRVDFFFPQLSTQKSLEYQNKKILSLFSRFFRNSFFQLKAEYLGVDIIERGRKQPIMMIKCYPVEQIIAIKSHALATYHGILAFYADPQLQIERFEKFRSSHQQICDILVKAFRLIDPEDVK